MIAANGTIVDDNVPRPEGDRVPLLNLEAFLLARGRGAVNFHVRCHSETSQGIKIMVQLINASTFDFSLKWA